MYERFTDRARKVMQLANQEAQRFNHEYIGTEHILLGLIKEGSGVAAVALKNLNIDLRKIRLEVEKLVFSGPDQVQMGKLPHTPRSKKVIECSIEAARERGDNYVGTEHILIGLLREGEGVACQVLTNLGVFEDALKEVLVLLGDKESVSPLPFKMPTKTPIIEGAIEQAIANQDFEVAAALKQEVTELKQEAASSKYGAACLRIITELLTARSPEETFKAIAKIVKETE